MFVRTFDYGDRIFSVIAEGDEVYLMDNEGRKYLNPPKPRHNERESARREFNALKKYYLNDRKRALERAESAMVLNKPVPMLDVPQDRVVYWARGQEYLFMDGEYFTSDGEVLDKNEVNEMSIVTRLVPHPITFRGLTERWSELFSDYEIHQPFPQIGRPVFLGNDLDMDAFDYVMPWIPDDGLFRIRNAKVNTFKNRGSQVRFSGFKNIAKVYLKDLDMSLTFYRDKTIWRIANYVLRYQPNTILLSEVVTRIQAAGGDIDR